MGYLFIINCVLLLILSIRYYKKICNPISYYTIIFILASIFFILEDYLDNLLKQKAFFYLSIGSTIFCGTFLLINYLKNDKKYIYVYNLKTVNKLINISVISSIISLGISLYEVLPLARNIENIIFNSTWIRIQYLERSSNIVISIIGVVSNMTTLILICLFPIAYYNKMKNITLKLSIIIFFRLGLSIITMSKDSFLLFLVILITAFIENIKNYKLEIKFLIKKGIYFVVLIIILLLIVAIQRSYIGNQYDNYGEAIYKTIGTYLLLPLESFSILISNSEFLETTKGIYSFRPIFNFISYLGLIDRISIIQEVIVGARANVYTMFGTMYRDFEEYGIIIISILYGVICGLLYSKNNKRKLSKIYINSLISTILLFAYYDFKFIQTIYIVSILYSIILEKILFSKLYYRKKINKI